MDALDTATNVAWITCIATTTLSTGFVQSLIVYYEPKNEALCRFYFGRLVDGLENKNAAAIGDQILDNLGKHNLQLRIPRDYLSSLRFLRGTTFGALTISALMLVASVVLYFFSEKVQLIEGASISEVTRLLAFLSLTSVILCVIWIISYTSHLEIKNPIFYALNLSDLRNTTETTPAATNNNNIDGD